MGKYLFSTVYIIILLAATPGLATGPYLGQTSPGTTPRLFAPGILTQPGGVVAVSRIAFSPDGKECFFSGPINWSFSGTRMYYTKCVDNVWTPHVLASFFPGYSCRQPYFSADGNKLYFNSNRNGNPDIWVTERTPEGWGNPQVLPAPINSSLYDGMYTQTTDGTAYIESMRSGGRGGIDVWRISPQQPDQPHQIQNLGSPVNTGADDNDPAISPDGKYLIFGSNYNDLFVSFNRGNGNWTVPVNLNQFCPGINTGAQEYAPFISADGRYLFFNRLSSGGIFWVENPIPSPDPNGPVLNLSTGERFGTIQAAIIYAQACDILELQPGIYSETVNLSNKNLTLQSVDPNDTYYVGGTIIQDNADNPVVTLQENSVACEIAGLTIRAGLTGIKGIATNAAIRNCRIMDNATHGIELSEDSNPHLLNCLITSNGQTGITMLRGPGRSSPYCTPLVENCIIVQNGSANIVGGEPVIVDSIITTQAAN
ncbi:MAG: right-handed parallel beta-helix repeat-containing protein [Phycisphaerales bacterium]